MNYLFFFVHPSKFHVFRQTINHLIKNGHQVEILITSKDILEDLVKLEGWKYTNIFPEGRKIKGLPSSLSSAINLIRTIYRLFKFTRNKSYDLFVTDDLLVFIGKWKKIKTFVLVDDDLAVVKQFAIVLSQSDYILAPEITNIGKYESKKIGFPGYKELAYLHPNHFKPDISIIRQFNPDLRAYFLIRLVSLRAYHDVGMKGISDVQLEKLIQILETKGKVFISSERNLPEKFEKYRIKINPLDISNVLYFAQLFIGDSQTMTSEAAILGTPAFRCNDFAGKISVMEEKEIKYGLSFNFPPSRFDEMYLKIKEVLEIDNFKNDFNVKREKMLEDKIDLTSFMINLFEKFPHSVDQHQKGKTDFSIYKFKA
jgi:uncharacterized protein